MALALLSWCGSKAATGPLNDWRWRNPLPEGNGLGGVAYGEGQFVGVGFVGTILTSSNGVDWIRIPSPTQQHLLGVAYGAGVFVAVGYDVILRSSNGTSWMVQPAVITNTLASVAYVNGRFLVGADGGTILSSADGFNWATIQLASSGETHAFSYAAGVYVAGRSDGIWSSTDAIHWNFVRAGAHGAVFGIAVGDGKYVAVGWSGGILVSDDAVQWVDRSLGNNPGSLLTVIYTNGCFVAAGQGLLRRSEDGTNWTDPSSSFSGVINSLAFANGSYIGLGALLVWGSGLQLWASSNLVDWVSELKGETGALWGVAYGNNRFVAVGAADIVSWSQGMILSSFDGKSWQREAAPRTALLTGVTFGDAGFIASSLDPGIVLRSVDGVYWFTKTNGLSAGLWDVFFAKDRYVAVADPTYPDWYLIATSTNGTDWVGHYPVPHAAALRGVTFGQDLFVVVGEGGQVVTSQDGLTWSPQASGTSLALLGVAYGNGHFVAVGNQNDLQSVLLRSPDGTNWLAVGGGPDLPFKIAFREGWFVVVGSQGRIWTSSDGLSWTARTWPAYLPLHGIEYGNGTFVAVGSYGTILQSGSLLTPLLDIGWDRSTSVPKIGITGAIGRRYRIDYTTRLNLPWTPLTNVTLPTPVTSWLDHGAGPATNRYYRAVLVN